MKFKVQMVAGIGVLLLLLNFQNCTSARGAKAQSGATAGQTNPTSSRMGGVEGYDGYRSYQVMSRVTCGDGATARSELFVRDAQSTAWMTRDNCAKVVPPVAVDSSKFAILEEFGGGDLNIKIIFQSQTYEPNYMGGLPVVPIVPIVCRSLDGQVQLSTNADQNLGTLMRDGLNENYRLVRITDVDINVWKGEASSGEGSLVLTQLNLLDPSGSFNGQLQIASFLGPTQDYLVTCTPN